MAEESANLIEAAISSNGVTNKDAAKIAGFREVTFYARHVDPGSWRLRELARIYRKLNRIGRGLLLDGIKNFFLHGDLT